jgi:hypothetical protein
MIGNKRPWLTILVVDEVYRSEKSESSPRLRKWENRKVQK